MLQYKTSELHEEWVRTEDSEQAKRRDVKSSEQII